MKAITYSTYGSPDVLTLSDLPKPVPKAGQVLIRIHASTVSTADWRARSLEMPAGFRLFARPFFGFLGPRQPILGTELSGTIESVGTAVTRFRPGDTVFAFTGAKLGCHAEYICLAETALIAPKPPNLSFEQAAALCFGGTTALPFLRDLARVQPGEKVLVVGASGCVGSAGVQIARAFGAEVTGVCSGRNRELVLSIGASQVIDHTTSDFAQSGQSWDVIFDTTGTAPYHRCKPVLRPGGRLVVVLGTIGQVLGLGRPKRGSGHKVFATVALPGPDDMRSLAELAATGAFIPVIDRIYPLDHAAEAHAVVDSGHKRGSVVLSMVPS